MKRLILILFVAFCAWSQQTVSLLTVQQVSISAYPVTDAAGTKSLATLSHFSLVNPNTHVLTLATDPANPAGVIITAVNPGKTTIQIIAQATEPDGVTTESVQGTIPVTVTAPVATGLMFTIGVPSPHP